ncbi:MAG: phosphatidate cytidylyltransferase [Candidatus Omnitrophica bacterium]|nr:phosphatidate cytidylyltransferase [Candidatus Omnitrophota bacterium]MCM8793306.1 phosphatidate cytidylyltransferase [Candidatus Omnitrophota bacterium]
MKVVYERFMVGILLSILLLLILVSSSFFGAGLVIIVVGISLLEFYNLVEKKGIVISKKFGITLGCLIPLLIYLNSLFKVSSPDTWEIVFTILICFIIFGVQFTRRDSQQAIAVLSTTIFGILYISWPLSFFVKFLYMEKGRWLIAYLLLVIKSGDVGAYLVGMNFGQHTLIKRISPNKSKEGTLGGLFFSMLASFVMGKVYLGMKGGESILLGLFLGILGQLGDLCESLLKRDCQVKDSGKIFPGLGGMLDLIDSIIFAVPFFYLYVNFFLR